LQESLEWRINMRSLEALTLLSLRIGCDVTPKALAATLGSRDDKVVTRYETGDRSLTREKLDELVAPLGTPPEAVDLLLYAFGLIFPDRVEGAGAGKEADPFDLAPDERQEVDRLVLVAGWAVAEELRTTVVRRKREEKLAAARREAEASLAELLAAPRGERRQLVRIYAAFRSWAMVTVLCEASVEAAAHRVEQARELADLALFVARRLPGKKRNRLRAEAFAWAFVANAYRVATDFDAASRAFAHAWALWRLGVAWIPELFPEWRLFDLEASLRRAQHRFAEALERLDQALAKSDRRSLVAGRLLLQKANVLEHLGDPSSALAALEEAAPTIEASQDSDLLLRLRFNTVVNLVALERFGEAERLLPEVQERAIEQAWQLDLNRVVWLTAKVRSGQGQVQEAAILLEQVIREFTALGLAYEAALASLDLAVLWLEAGRMAEVQGLALGMGWIFQVKGIAREALAALALFREAAEQETATVELAKKVIAEVEEAQGSASPS
jgi:tetratricopeptide (TPR) repeat protein